MPGSEYSTARVVGDSEVGPQKAVTLGVEDGRHHLHVVGATGSGKSTLLANLALADMVAGRGVVLIDPKGDLVEDVLARLPERALERLVLLDPKECEAPPALNVLEGEPAEVAVDHVVSVFARIFSAWWGPRTEDVLRSACSTLRRLPGATLADVPLLLTDRRFRAPLVSSLSERSGLKGFWDAYDALSPAGQAQVIGPIMNKLRAVLARRFARDLFGSATSSFDLREVLSGGVLLARLPKGILGEDTARLVGALLVASVWQAATARADDHVRPDATLYVDECQNFLALPTAVDDALAEARGYHLSVVLAHQHLGQLPKDLFEAASANARNNLCFTSLVSTQHRLVALFRLGILDRFRPLRPTGSESWRYSLGPVGAAIVAAERGVEAPRPSVLRDRVVALAAGQRTTHTLGVNGFFCALHKVARERPAAEVVAWWPERRCAAEWGELVRPDAYGIWEKEGQRVEFFLEHDTGSEPLSRVAGKLAGYRDLAEADGTARPVLFWLTQPGREPGMRQALGDTSLPVAMAVVGMGNPADAIWLPVGEEAPRRPLAKLSALAAEATR